MGCRSSSSHCEASLQQDMSYEMVHLACKLKESSLLMNQYVQDAEKILVDSTERAREHSLASTGRAARICARLGGSIMASLDEEYNSLNAATTVSNMKLNEFYSYLLLTEQTLEQQARVRQFSAAANAAARGYHPGGYGGYGGHQSGNQRNGTAATTMVAVAATTMAAAAATLAKEEEAVAVITAMTVRTRTRAAARRTSAMAPSAKSARLRDTQPCSVEPLQPFLSG